MITQISQLRATFLGALLTLPSSSLGEVFLVTNLNDDGPGSLRAAITDANNTSAPDIIRFSDGQNGSINFKDGNSRILSVNSTLNVTQPVEIQGPGRELLALDGGGDRDFILEAGESRVLSLRGSNNTNSQRILDLTIQNGTALLGGANIQVIGSLDLIRCTVRGGRAIAQDRNANTNNQNNADGGGLNHLGLTLLVDSCDFVDNGTIGNFSQGGGLYSQSGTALLRNSRFYQNTTEGRVSEGGGIGLRSDTIMENCEVSENETLSSSSGGGGIYTDDVFTAIQTTISGNRVGENTGITGYSVGGAFASVGFQNATFEHCTIINNDAPSGAGQSGGISSFSSGTISLFNTILAGNRAADLERIPGSSTRFRDLGFNLFGTGPGFNLIPTRQASSVYGISAPLNFISDLAFHGGRTRTHRLIDNGLPGPRAIDAGPTRAQWLSARGSTFLLEQRGTDFPRIVNNRLDIGAYEFQADIDRDNDGLPDAVEEIVNGLDPNVADGDQDLDQDGLSNLAEYTLSGITAITDRSECFTVNLTSNLDEITIRFNSSPNREYRIRSASNLSAPLAEIRSDFARFPENNPQELSLPTAGPRAFFQIEAQIPEALREIFE